MKRCPMCNKLILRTEQINARRSNGVRVKATLYVHHEDRRQNPEPFTRNSYSVGCFELEE